jgi:acyl-coenzyme A thioesterase PaaI-like protein
MKLPIPDLIDRHRPDLAAAIAAMPCSRLLGLSVLGLGDGVSAIELPLRPDLTFDGKTVQGGIVGTLADFSAVSAATAALPLGWISSTGFSGL